MTGFEQQRAERAGRGAHGGIAMVMALTVSGAFPSGSMVTAACPVTGILATGGGGVSFLVCVGAGDDSLAGWRLGVDESEEVRLRAKMGRRRGDDAIPVLGPVCAMTRGCGGGERRRAARKVTCGGRRDREQRLG